MERLKITVNDLVLSYLGIKRTVEEPELMQGLKQATDELRNDEKYESDIYFVEDPCVKYWNRDVSVALGQLANLGIIEIINDDNLRFEITEEGDRVFKIFAENNKSLLEKLESIFSDISQN